LNRFIPAESKVTAKSCCLIRVGRVGNAGDEVQAAFEVGLIALLSAWVKA